MESKKPRGELTARECIPDQNKIYKLEDVLDMVYVDCSVRNMVSNYDLDELGNSLVKLNENESIRLFNDERLRMVITKIGDNFKVYALAAISTNDRQNGGAQISAEDENFGRQFMGLGGNSKPPGRY